MKSYMNYTHSGTVLVLALMLLLGADALLAQFCDSPYSNNYSPTCCTYGGYAYGTQGVYRTCYTYLSDGSGPYGPFQCFTTNCNACFDPYSCASWAGGSSTYIDNCGSSGPYCPCNNASC